MTEVTSKCNGLAPYTCCHCRGRNKDTVCI